MVVLGIVVSKYLLDLQHHLMLLILDGKLHVAPIENIKGGLHNVLDIATGTGIWAIDFGTEAVFSISCLLGSCILINVTANAHPSASVIGTDLSPIQPDLFVILILNLCLFS